MEEQRLLKKQFYLHIFYNMIAFACIFVAFGIFMFYMIKTMTFSSVDDQLKKAQNEYNDNARNNTEILYKIFGLENNDFLDDTRNAFFEEFKEVRKINNPQINVIIRQADGTILNENNLGRIGEYVDEISFDPEILNTIYTVKIGDAYNYRALNFQISYTDEYVQLLINVDSEIALINSYVEIIVKAVIIGIVLSAVASLVLSKKTMKPIETTLRNQTEFVQNASHELRTPLTIIQAKQELLLQEPNSKIIDKSEDIMLTLNETKRLSKLTKDLMLLVRENNLKLQKEDVVIDDFISSIIEPYKDLAEAQRKKIRIGFEFWKRCSN